MDAQAYADKILRLTVRLEMLAKATDTKNNAVIVALKNELVSILSNSNAVTKKAQGEVTQRLVAVTDTAFDKISNILDEAGNIAATASVQAEVQGYALLADVSQNTVSKTRATAIAKGAFQRSMGTILPDVAPRITVGQMISKFTDTPIRGIRNYTAEAFQQGYSISRMARDLTNASGLQKNAAKSVARTSIMATSNTAREQVAQEYGADKEMILATLDTRTCDFCASRDGRCGPMGQLPIYPAHPNCRCVKLYMPYGVSCNGMKNDLERTARDENGKSYNVGKYENYGSWLKTQDLSVQQEFLGKNRAAQFNAGDVTFKKMFTQEGSFKSLET